MDISSSSEGKSNHQMPSHYYNSSHVCFHSGELTPTTKKKFEGRRRNHRSSDRRDSREKQGAEHRELGNQRSLLVVLDMRRLHEIGNHTVGLTTPNSKSTFTTMESYAQATPAFEVVSQRAIFKPCESIPVYRTELDVKKFSYVMPLHGDVEKVNRVYKWFNEQKQRTSKMGLAVKASFI
ncbi:hypothetical protein VNO77_15133 [Canavalia gladiata]|uniref:Uncharacterized protein n=1 Tax=Canavalia gladiata TaxID=3824 RepID=A0AAN9M3Q0_CANGL